MKQLVEASGVHRQTVHAYLRQAVLPPACRAPGTRNARYGSEHVVLLGLVRELRDQRGMSLEAIRRCFERADFDPGEVRRSLESAAAPASVLVAIQDPELVSALALTHEAGVPARLLDALVEAGVVAPEPTDAAGRFDRPVATVLVGARRLLDAGVSEEHVVRLAKLAQGIAGLEASLFAADAAGATDGSEQAARRAEERHERVTTLVAAVRLLVVRGVGRRLAQVGPRSRAFAQEAIYIPSPLFVKRYGLDEVVAAAEQAAAQGRGDAGGCLGLGRLLLGLGRYEEAELWLARAARLAPDDAEIQEYLGLARAVAGRMAAALEAARRAVTLAPESPRAHTFLASVLALAAASAAGLAEAGEGLRRALEVAARSRTLVAEDLREHMEVLLARGRLFTVLPGQLPGHAEGLTDLEEVLTRTQHATDASNEFDYPGSNALYRLHALYYLGVNAWSDGDRDRGGRWLSECIAIDPASRFAERAYELLSEASRS
jgi:tetratricopeptide (TPR) repeat protein